MCEVAGYSEALLVCGDEAQFGLRTAALLQVGPG